MKKALFKFLRFSGLPFIFREILQRKKVSIILFHDINPEIADNSFAYLCKHYNIITITEFLKAAESGKKEALPAKAMILTFDDGHIGNFELLPVLEKYNIAVTVFLVAALVNTKRYFWFQYQKISNEVEDFKKLPNKERLEKLKSKGYDQETEFEYPQALNSDQINMMKNKVDFQSHTMFHPILTRCTLDEAEYEIKESKTLLETVFGLTIEGLAYPNGDYTEREVEIARKSGYKYGLTLDPGFNSLNTDLFRLKRISVNDTIDINEFIVKSCGLWSFIRGRKKY